MQHIPTIEGIFQTLISHIDESGFLTNELVSPRLYKSALLKIQTEFLKNKLHYEDKSATIVVDGDFIRNDTKLKDKSHTEIFENLQTAKDSIASSLCFNLIKAYRLNAFCSLFSSGKSATSLGRHIDQWHNLVIQLKGEKSWSFYRNKEFISEARVCAGDILLVPLLFEHEVKTIKNSIHISIGFLDPISKTCTHPHT